MTVTASSLAGCNRWWQWYCNRRREIKQRRRRRNCKDERVTMCFCVRVCLCSVIIWKSQYPQSHGLAWLTNTYKYLLVLLSHAWSLVSSSDKRTCRPRSTQQQNGFPFLCRNLYHQNETSAVVITLMSRLCLICEWATNKVFLLTVKGRLVV